MQDKTFMMKHIAAAACAVFALLLVFPLALQSAPSDAEKPRKCYKCLGKGTQTVSVREPCDVCEGLGYTSAKVQLKDTVNGTYYWQYHYRTTREAVKKTPCAKCSHRGVIPVKKQVPCAKCKGSGLLNRDGTPYRAPGEDTEEKEVPAAVADATDEEDEMPKEKPSLAERLRQNKVKVSSSGIVAPSGKGWVEFDCTANGGRFKVSGKGAVFDTVWAPVSEGVVRVSKGGAEMLGFRPGMRQLPSVSDELETCDWSRPSIRIGVGQVVAFMNHDGRFLAVRLCEIVGGKVLHVEFTVY